MRNLLRYLACGRCLRQACALLALAYTAALGAAPMVIIHGERPVAEEPKNAYKAELLTLLMEVTRPEFGDYQIQSYTNASSAKRQSLLISEGDQLNVLWASPGTPISKANVIEVSVDALRGLLGYRVCLTTQGNQAAWGAVKDLLSLNNIRIGQVDHWPDADVYRFNRIRLVGTPSFEGLFDMLSVDRFDCLPLGADEVETIYRARKALLPELAIEPSLLIYYQYPLYLYVSAKHPEIAQRLRRGFELIQRSGQFDQLFERYFRQDLAALKLPERRILCLKSPFMATDKQCLAPQDLSFYRRQPPFPLKRNTSP